MPCRSVSKFIVDQTKILWSRPKSWTFWKTTMYHRYTEKKCCPNLLSIGQKLFWADQIFGWSKLFSIRFKKIKMQQFYFDFNFQKFYCLEWCPIFVDSALGLFRSIHKTQWFSWSIFSVKGGFFQKVQYVFQTSKPPKKYSKKPSWTWNLNFPPSYFLKKSHL